MSRRAITLAQLGAAARQQAVEQIATEEVRRAQVKAKAAPLNRKRGNKYKAKPVEVDGIWFASTAEAKRYRELKLSERAGTITDLELQPRFPIVVSGIAVGEYRADFAYRAVPAAERVIEDVKGMRTPVYRLKKRLVEALYGIKIIEVQA